jgi:hypothetical protein
MGPGKVKCFCGVLVVFVGLCATARAQQDDPLRAVHDALFASFLPVDELRGDARDSALLASANESVWSAVNADPRVRAAVASFADLRGFHGACGIGFADEGKPVSIADLDVAKRREVLDRLEHCEVAGPRSAATAVHTFYIVRGYEAIQEPLSGETLKLFAPAEYVDAHRPVLPASRLVYDARNKELREEDGHAIDVLIVGSGPAGSVLAHELRRGGRRVLLLERGSFLVPGSMETRLIDGLLDNKTTVDGGIRVHNGVAVGGGTAVNVDLCFAPTSDEIRTRI